MYTIRLQSSDGKVFDTNEQIAKCSGTIKAMLDNCVIDEGEDVAIPLPNVDSAVLCKILQWVKYHNDHPDEDENEKTSTYISPLETEFLNTNQEMLFELILAANYLNIQCLLKVCSETVANMIKGKTTEEIRKIFNIKNDFSDAEKEEIRQKNEAAPLTSK